MELPYLETHLVDHCNLNCKGCSHFSPLSVESFVKFSIFEKDFLRLRELFDNIKEIRLMGGEPLLHPELLKFLECTRLIFPNSKICLVTNGIILNSQMESFWENCSQNNILIQITRYPIKLDIASILRKAEKFHLQIEVSDMIKIFGKFMNSFGNSDPIISYSKCSSLSKCPNLRDGKIYVCWFAPLVQIYNNYFGKNIPISESDFINIHEKINGSDIKKFLNHPTSLCRWCLYDRPIFKWQVSKKKNNEWISFNSNPIDSIKTIYNNGERKLIGFLKCLYIFFVRMKRHLLQMSNGSIRANPNPVYTNNDGLEATTTLNWTSSQTKKVEIHINTSDGPLLCRGGPCGSVSTGNWVQNGMIFYLQDITNSLPLTYSNTLDFVKVQVVKKE
jgi:hypothetical protein